jgi:hypothetical protein
MIRVDRLADQVRIKKMTPPFTKFKQRLIDWKIRWF